MVNSFTVFAVGVLARNPEVFIDKGETVAKLCLVGNDFEEIPRVAYLAGHQRRY